MHLEVAKKKHQKSNTTILLTTDCPWEGNIEKWTTELITISYMILLILPI